MRLLGGLAVAGLWAATSVELVACRALHSNAFTNASHGLHLTDRADIGGRALQRKREGQLRFLTETEAQPSIQMITAPNRINLGSDIKGPAEWVDTGGAGVRVYVLDSGIRSDHIIFGSTPPVNFFRSYVPSGSFEDTTGHGTGVAGSVVDPETGVACRAQIVNVPVMAPYQGNRRMRRIYGLRQALQDITTEHNGYKAQARQNPSSAWRGSVIIWTGTFIGFQNDIDPAIQAAAEAGIPIITAAGNSAQTNVHYEASSTYTFTIGAVNYDYSLWSGPEKGEGSNYGPAVDAYAPGDEIIVADWEGDTNAMRYMSGTSVAAPIGASIAALIVSYEGLNSNWNSVQDVYIRMEELALRNKLDLPNNSQSNNVLLNNGVKTRSRADGYNRPEGYPYYMPRNQRGQPNYIFWVPWPRKSTRGLNVVQEPAVQGHVAAANSSQANAAATQGLGVDPPSNFDANMTPNITYTTELHSTTTSLQLGLAAPNGTLIDFTSATYISVCGSTSCPAVSTTLAATWTQALTHTMSYDPPASSIMWAKPAPVTTNTTSTPGPSKSTIVKPTMTPAKKPATSTKLTPSPSKPTIVKPTTTPTKQPATSTKLTPSPSETCHTHYYVRFDGFIINGSGWNLTELDGDGPYLHGDGLKRNLEGCSALTGWAFRNLTISPGEPYEFEAAGFLIFGEQECIKHAIKSSGAPDDVCGGST